MKLKGLGMGLVCALALCFGLVGCGGGGSSAAAAENFVGSWTLHSIESESGGGSSAEDVQLMNAFGLNVEVNFSDDGTCALVMFGESLEGTWQAKDASTATISMEGQNVEVAIDEDGYLSLAQDGDRLVFERAEAED